MGFFSRRNKKARARPTAEPDWVAAIADKMEDKMEYEVTLLADWMQGELAEMKGQLQKIEQNQQGNANSQREADERYAQLDAQLRAANERNAELTAELIELQSHVDNSHGPGKEALERIRQLESELAAVQAKLKESIQVGESYRQEYAKAHAQAVERAETLERERDAALGNIKILGSELLMERRKSAKLEEKLAQGQPESADLDGAAQNKAAARTDKSEAGAQPEQSESESEDKADKIPKTETDSEMLDIMARFVKSGDAWVNVYSAKLPIGIIKSLHNSRKLRRSPSNYTNYCVTDAGIRWYENRRNLKRVKNPESRQADIPISQSPRDPVIAQELDIMWQFVKENGNFVNYIRVGIPGLIIRRLARDGKLEWHPNVTYNLRATKAGIRWYEQQLKQQSLAEPISEPPTTDAPPEQPTDLPEIAKVVGAPGSDAARLLAMMMRQQWACAHEVLETAFPDVFVNTIIDDMNEVASDELGTQLIYEDEDKDDWWIVDEHFRDDLAQLFTLAIYRQ